MRENLHTAWNKAYSLVSSPVYSLPSTPYFYHIRTRERCSYETVHKFSTVMVLEWKSKDCLSAKYFYNGKAYFKFYHIVPMFSCDTC